jgi:hypothetical protein
MAKDSLGLEFISYIPSLNLNIVVKKATNYPQALRCVIAGGQLKQSRVWPRKLIRRAIAKALHLIPGSLATFSQHARAVNVMLETANCKGITATDMRSEKRDPHKKHH